MRTDSGPLCTPLQSEFHRDVSHDVAGALLGFILLFTGVATLLGSPRLGAYAGFAFAAFILSNTVSKTVEFVPGGVRFQKGWAFRARTVRFEEISLLATRRGPVGYNLAIVTPKEEQIVLPLGHSLTRPNRIGHAVLARKLAQFGSQTDRLRSRDR